MEKYNNFKELLDYEFKLFVSKNTEYSGKDDIHGNPIRVSKILSLYPNLKLSNPETILIVYMMKHLDSILYNLSNNNKMSIESYKERLIDLAIYINFLILLIERGDISANI